MKDMEIEKGAAANIKANGRYRVGWWARRQGRRIMPNLVTD